ncbi:YkvA family protein [Arthrobacter sp. Soc17.1.1.1]|uniref:YkvA family protein n=1 Tax=Arthrobacter sp. Soc17.1.1.1 TaxID=3121277 RepID=UPI002FE42D4F
MNWWDVAIAVIGGVVLIYAVLLVFLASYARRHPETVSLKEALRLLPDLLTLLRRLTADRTLPRGIRVRLVLLLMYLASPIDLVPDFLPVIGYADDAIIVALVLRSVIRRAGSEPLEQHWPGSPAGLSLIQRLAGTSTP